MNGIDTIDVISRMKLGASDSEIASSVKAKVADIREIRIKASEQGLIPVKFRPPKPRVTHEERRQRQKQIVEWLNADESRTKEQAAEHFGLSVRTIGMFVQQKRGKPAPSKLSHKDTFRAAAMFVMNKSNSDIGRELNVTREHVRMMRESATEAGFFEAIKQFLEANTGRK